MLLGAPLLFVVDVLLFVVVGCPLLFVIRCFGVWCWLLFSYYVLLAAICCLWFGECVVPVFNSVCGVLCVCCCVLCVVVCFVWLWFVLFGALVAVCCLLISVVVCCCFVCCCLRVLLFVACWLVVGCWALCVGRCL